MLTACGKSATPHPQGWTQAPSGVWTSSDQTQTFLYRSTRTAGSISDLASAQAVATVQRYSGAHLIDSVPFAACPGEAGLARYTVGGDALEIAFTVYHGNAITAEYRRPMRAPEAAAALAALRESVCWGTL